MRIQSVCMECSAKDNRREASMFVSVDYVDGTLKQTCDQGHETRCVLSATDFEVLFEFGGMALLDGYTREAVSSIAAALERGYMCFVEVALLKAAVKDDVTMSVLKELRRSERQLGSFVSMYAMLEGATPPLLPNKSIEFRNSCIHEGQIPSRAEVEEYAQRALTILEHLSGLFRTKYQDEFRKVTGLRPWKAAIAEGFNPSSMSIPTMLSHTHPSIAVGMFTERLDRLRGYRSKVWRS
jgi:hypothetical protein